MNSAVGLVTISPPELKTPRGNEVVKFSIAYERYSRNVDEVNANLPAYKKIKPVGYKACVAAELLVSLVDLETFDECNEVSMVTDDMVEKWVKERSRCTADDIPSHVKDALARVRFKMDSMDPEGACLNFFTDVITQLRRNRVKDVIDGNPKIIIQSLIPKLEPESVRDSLKNAFEYWSPELKKDFKNFRKEVVKSSIECAKYARTKQKHSNPRPTKKATTSTEKDVSGNDPYPKTVHDDSEPSKESKKRKWKSKCLNPECSEIHPLFKCKNTSPELKKELLKKYRDSKKAKVLKMHANHVRDGGYSILLPGNIQCTAIGDNGADQSSIAKSIVSKLRKSNVDLKEEKFPEPMRLEPAFKLPKNVSFTASSTIKIDVQVILPCGKLLLRNTPFLVVDQEMDEVLLGRPLLKHIGFDLNDHLTELVKEEKEFDISDSINTVDFAPKKIYSLHGYRGLWHNQIDDDPIRQNDAALASMGNDDPADIDNAITDILNAAAKEGMKGSILKEGKVLLNAYKDVLRINLGKDAPARVDPYRISLRKGYQPYRSTQRRYAQVQKAFIEATVRSLESIGAIYKNPRARWASPALTVPKPGTDKLRFTVDLRGVNRETEPVASAMPDLESMYRSVGGSRFFAKIDMCHAYWQIPLDKNSQEMMSIQTPLGVYSPTRILQGSTDAGNHFQSVTSQIFSELSSNILQWLDDFLLHAQTEQQLMSITSKFFELCRASNLKIHAQKIEMFKKEAHFCGRIVDGDGFKFDPRRMQALTDMKHPEFAGDLQQFLCATNWIRSSIPMYSEVIAPLHNLMELCYKKAGRRTRKSVAKISLAGLWGGTHSSAFQQIKSHLSQAIKLAHPKEGHITCLFSDASDLHWASILTQVPKNQMTMKVEDQNHEVLSFLSGSFKGHLHRWSVVEKEAFAVVESMTRLDFLTSAGEVHLFTDHSNLTYIFDPYGQNPGINRQVATKLMRWALKLSAYRYVIEYLPGNQNVWADMMTRWAVSSERRVDSTKIGRVMFAPVNPSSSEKFDAPCLEDIEKSQRSSTEVPPKQFKRVGSIIQDDQKVIWIPSDDDDLKIRILIAAHCGPSGHRAKSTTLRELLKHFYWKEADNCVDSFVKSCLHCLCTSSGKSIPRPFGHAIHATKPNEVIHFDYCYLGKSNIGPVYVLIVKDDLSSYTWLFPCDAPNTENVVDALTEWISSFGAPSQWVSDQGTHFKNEAMTVLKERLRCAHHFTLPYCPWTNGTVEVVCRELLRIIRALLSEFQLPFKVWPTLIPMVQSVLNNTSIPRLGNIAPITAFMGMKASTPLLHIKSLESLQFKLMSISAVRAKQVMQIETFLTALDQMHKEVSDNVQRARTRAVQLHNRRTHVKKCNFDKGDYVLRGLVRGKASKNSIMRWTGPYRVFNVLSDFVFELEDIRTANKYKVHGSRIKFFRNSDLNVSEELKEFINFQEGDYSVVDQMLDIRKSGKNIEVQVRWLGFEDEPTWTCITQLSQDVPAMLNEFLETIHASGTQQQKSAATSYSKNNI